MKDIKHHMIDVVSPKENFSMADFKKMADIEIEKIINDNKIPMIVGGTGFYIQSLVRNVEMNEEEQDDDYRNQLYEEAKKYGNHYVHEKLKDIDKVSYDTIHENNLKRVVRALEFYKNNNEPISKHNEIEKAKEIEAAFVICNDANNEVMISARSNGHINVQVIMEKMNGGGHMSAAGLQRKDTSVKKLVNELYIVLDEYFKGDNNESNIVE